MDYIERYYASSLGLSVMIPAHPFATAEAKSSLLFSTK